VTGPDPLLGTHIVDRYELLERIGDGGMGVVYRARDEHGQLVAVKILADHLTRDPVWVKRFDNEVAAIRQLDHPGIVRLVDAGQTPMGRLFMVMELLAGRSLRDVLEREGRLAPERVLRLLRETCAPLAAAHARKVFHRDLKPDNIFLLPGDKVKLLDFSVAKLRQPDPALATAAGVIFGTPQYMSPEQARGLPVDQRSDLYSLGVVAFELLVGVRPFEAADPMEILARQVRMALPPLPPEVPAPLVQVIDRLCAKDPADRFQDAGELAEGCVRALRQLRAPTQPPPIASFEPGSARATGDPGDRGPLRRRAPLWAWPLAVLSGGTIGFLAFKLYSAWGQ
jgi:serine/threonine protein kinase